MAFSSAAGRDGLYLGFLLFHAICTICIDIQPLLPKPLQLDISRRLLDFYLKNTSDPLMLGARSQDPNYLWFRWFLLQEGLVFLPCFIFGIRGLLKGKSNLRIRYASPRLWLYIAGIKFQSNNPRRPSGEIPLTSNYLHTNPRYGERLPTTIGLCCCGLNHHGNMPCGDCVWAPTSRIHLHRTHGSPEC